ncbi:MAG: rod shape-determining protein MreC [Bacteroidales bacterium]|nr:rod shape-determining protein MreC [Bacteroidales bacterium]
MQKIINFLIKHNHWFLFLLLEGISFVLIVSFNNYQSAAMFTSANGIAGNIFAAITDIDSYFGLKDENEALLQHNRELINETSRLKEELSAYRDSTAIAESPYTKENAESGFYYLTARVVNSTIKDANYFITIDKGEEDRVTPQMGVFNDKGVVGITYTSSENFTIVLPLLNSKSRLSCRVKGSNSYCTLQWDGDEAGYSYLVDLPRYAEFTSGDTVVTSGFSSIFPEGLPVGSIESIEDSDDGLFYKARVKLFVDFGSVDNLFIVGNDSKKEQEELEKQVEER